MYSLLHILMSEAQANWGTTLLASAYACQDSMPWQANTKRVLLASWGIEP